MPNPSPIRVPNDAETDWPCRPLLRGAWSDVPPDIAVAIEAEGARRANLPITMPFPIERMRSLPLAFYPGCFLVEGLARYSVHAAGVFRMIVGPDELRILDGTSPPIHEVNARALRLPNGAATDQYLRFFCGAIQGDAGPFGLVEDMGMLTINPALGAEDLARVRAAVRPLKRRRGAGGDVHAAAIVHGTALFRSRLKVQPDGMVEMISDEPVVPNVLERAGTYDGIWEVIEEPAGAALGRIL